jgi:hypothetical protein
MQRQSAKDAGSLQNCHQLEARPTDQPIEAALSGTEQTGFTPAAKLLAEPTTTFTSRAKW